MARESPLIDDVDVAGSRLRIRAGPEFARAFVREDFVVEYQGVPLDTLPRWILEMPFLLNALPIVWLSGRRFTVDEVDERLLESLEGIKHAFQRMYPHLGWNGDLRARRPVRHQDDSEDAASSDRVAILFTGGVDSIHSSIRHRDHPQLLISVWGPDIALDNRAGWTHVRELCAAHARRSGNEAAFVRSNLRSFMRYGALARIAPGIPVWWTHIQGGLGLSGLAAPLMAAKGCRRLLRNAHHNKDFHAPRGSGPDIEGALRWGTVSVSHEGYELYRQEKLREIVGWVRASGMDPPQIRPCFSYKYGSGTNCGRCEKCLRTMAGLIVEGEDPEHYGFPLDAHGTASLIRRQMRGRTMVFDTTKTFYWQDIQRHARASLRERDGKRPVGGVDMRPFLTWLSTADFDRYERQWRRIGALRAVVSRFLARFPSIERLVRRMHAAVRDRGPS